MINRLPKEFHLTGANGARNGASHVARRLASDAGFADRMAVAAARSIGRHPAITLSAAFLAGLIAGRILKR